MKLTDRSLGISLIVTLFIYASVASYAMFLEGKKVGRMEARNARGQQVPLTEPQPFERSECASCHVRFHPDDLRTP